MPATSTESRCSSQAYVTSDIDRHNKIMIKSPGDEFIPFPGLFALWRGIGGREKGKALRNNMGKELSKKLDEFPVNLYNESV